MPSNYPKFDQKINDQIQMSRMQQSRSRMGTVVAYEKTSNTITVVLESQYSDTIGNIVDKIPCPSIYRNTSSCSRTRRQVYHSVSGMKTKDSLM